MATVALPFFSSPRPTFVSAMTSEIEYLIEGSYDIGQCSIGSPECVVNKTLTLMAITFESL